MFTLLKGFSSKKINKNVIQHIHLPKCGGTTIDHIFQKYSLIDPTVKFFRFKQNRRELEIKNLNKNFEKNNIFFVSGHIQENFLKDLQTNNIFKFSIIRNPIERFFSHYKFYLYKKNINPDNFSIDEYIKNETLLKRDNILARTFANKIEKDIEVNTNIKNIAIKNIKDLDLFSNLENWNTIVNILISLFHLPNIFYSKYQQHKYSFNFLPTDRDVSAASEFNLLDIQIYNEIFSKKKIFSKEKLNFKINRSLNQYLIVSPVINQTITKENLLNEKNFTNLLDKLNIKLDKNK